MADAPATPVPDARSRLLVVDVGNTQTHFGVIEPGAEAISSHWRFATVRESTADELGARLAGLLGTARIGLEQIDSSIVSSTVPQLSGRWVAMAARYLHHAMLNVGPQLRTGMPLRVENPHEVGADRVVNAVAAYARFARACIVVDFGTAITYDVVSDAGEYLGGVIAPGAEISLDALSERAAKLPHVELIEPRTVIGKTTVDQIRSGIAYGYGGQVEGIVGRLRGALGTDAPVIATGGMAGTLTPFVRGAIDAVDELLTLRGLALIWRRNAG